MAPQTCCRPILRRLYCFDCSTILGMRAPTKMERPPESTMYSKQRNRYLSACLWVRLIYGCKVDWAQNFNCLADVIADLILLIAPLKLLQSLQDKQLRLRLMVIFSTCIVTTVVSLVHAVYILNHGGKKVVIVALVEVNKPFFEVWDC